MLGDQPHSHNLWHCHKITTSVLQLKSAATNGRPVLLPLTNQRPGHSDGCSFRESGPSHGHRVSTKKTMQCFAFNTVQAWLLSIFTDNLASIYHVLAFENEYCFGQGYTHKRTDFKLYKYWYIDTSVVMAWGWPLSVYWCHWSGKHCGCDSLTVTSIKKVKLLQVQQKNYFQIRFHAYKNWSRTIY